MKINDINRINATNPYRSQGGQSPTSSRKLDKSKDEVHISQQAKELLGAEQKQTERIDELKIAVQTGTYYVDANKIAEKLLPYLR